uniref:Secreted protein n=1 Tax=Parastrongyloides trichosuri TaxID=131310 RepID=A0A0N4ZGR8_PARTI
MKFFIIFASFIALVASDKLVIKDPTIINDDTLVKTDVIKFPIEIVTIKPKLPKIVSSDDEENEGLIRRYMGYLNDVNKNVKFFMKTKNVNPARVAEFY